MSHMTQSRTHHDALCGPNKCIMGVTSSQYAVSMIYLYTHLRSASVGYVVRPSSKSTQLPPSSIISTSSSMSSCA